KDVFRGARPTPSPTIVLGNALADTVARSLPLTSASSGLTFRYDASSGAFVRDTDLLGQLYLERARPIGRGKWNVTVSYQRVNVDSVQGQDLDELSDTAPPIIVGSFITSGPAGKRLVSFPRYAVGLRVDMVTLAATYGITDDLDVNLTLPILASRLSVGSTEPNFTLNPNPIPRLCPNATRLANGLTRCGPQNLHDVLHETGVGDLFLRGKYQLVHGGWLDVAAGPRLPPPPRRPDKPPRARGPAPAPPSPL